MNAARPPEGVRPPPLTEGGGEPAQRVILGEVDQ